MLTHHEEDPLVELDIQGTTSIIVSNTSHWPTVLKRGPTIDVSLASAVRTRRGAASLKQTISVQTWLSRVLRDALEGRSEVDHTLLLTDACVSFQIIFAGDPARIFHAIVTPQAALQKTLRDVLEEAVLPRLGADVHVALDKLRASIRVPAIILSNWADMKRTEEYLLPKASASHYEGLLSSVRGARSTAAKRQRSPTTLHRPTRPTTNLHSGAHHQAGSSPSGTGTAAKHLEFSAAAASPSLGPMGSPAQAAMVPTSTHLMPAPHYPTPVPASLPATELKVLNNWIQNRRLPKVHVAMSLLCQVCNLMPISPVIATCCGSTQCRACSNPTSALPPSAAAGSSKITCANCGEERFASEVLPPNQERAAAIERWMKDIAVLYREELAEMSRGKEGDCERRGVVVRHDLGGQRTPPGGPSAV
ncbi:Hypothetical protein, putative [Bodo saltans]|uniref:Uncharacterized protein n=1 Tax=Bodo saltans TaxID=75058 RepID=A0A0S4JA00_BODSA|nr:Hypothetical protein, putative [Bodo saltans]|eukprot:CUG88308.1 Hypothetical protein, putative [Bodo saltans]